MKHVDMGVPTQNAMSLREYDQTINDNFDELQTDIQRLTRRVEALESAQMPEPARTTGYEHISNQGLIDLFETEPLGTLSCAEMKIELLRRLERTN